MISDLFFSILYQPIYNGLVFLINVVPYGDVGLSVVLLTVFVKLILFPLTHKSTQTQAYIKKMEPEVNGIKELHKEDKQEQSRKIMELYKKHGINPFSGCLLFIVQMPIIIALYWVFWKGFEGGALNLDQLYSFISNPETVSMNFLGLLDISGKSLILALAAGISQFFQMRLAIPPTPEADKKENEESPSLKADFAKSFKMQMKYGLPVFVFFISYTISAVVALYWATSNIFSIGHELFVKKKAEDIISEE